MFTLKIYFPQAGGADGMDVDGGEETAGEGGVRPKAARVRHSRLRQLLRQGLSRGQRRGSC